MENRINKFYSRTSHTSDKTVVIDLTMKDVISQIILTIEGLNATAAMIAPLARAITQIDIVDGSDVLYSLDGEEAEAVDWYNNNGVFRANYNYQMNGGTCKRFIGINFGRHLWDRVFALDPTRFKNPQLRITLDSGVGANTCATLYLTAHALMFETPPAELRGFLMTKEFKQWTMASTTHEYTELPLDHTYRNLFLRTYLAGTEANQCVSNLKLSEDQDKRIPFDDDPFILYSTLLSKLPKVKEAYFYATDSSNRYMYIAPTTGVTATGNEWNTTATNYGTAFYDGDGGQLKTICSTTGMNTQIQVEGYVPHAVFMLPFGDQGNAEDWYDVRGLGSLKADITGGAAAQGYLFAQQVREY